MYNLLSEQVKEREKKKLGDAKLVSLEEEKKKLQMEEERRFQANKDRELQEARLGKIVRTSVKEVCESALGRKVEIPEDDDNEVIKLRKELEEIRTKSLGDSKEARVEALRKEKEALLKKNQESEEDRLRKDIADLRRNQEGGEEDRLRKEIAELKGEAGQGKANEGGQDAIIALQLQIKELSAFRTTLEEKNVELCTLKSENTHLKKDVNDLRDEFLTLRNKRTVGAVIESSPPEEPAKGKKRAVASTTAMYTPKDLEALQKAYKAALQGKEMAMKEADMLKERMAKMGASRIRLSARKSAFKKMTPRNLKTSFHAVEVESDDEKGKEGDAGRARSTEEVTKDLEVAKMTGFRDCRLKELRQAKKADMEAACTDEGISYIKLDQAKADVAEIRASQDFTGWLKEKDKQEEDDQQQHYATSTEEVGED
ncbi:hypothetical protein CBR_g55948 [Chara braunii]|uniref:Uncharacterized protein n=1 Tax=Chara braunii TaxID=69332 RepID=A0A388MDB5_CHABU|nr:hypothetical protein CBR_g55948 [Chara braunii]|eukprot:GBG92554.1 hypothetical protein CBR_g55948 [Chara braunii]